MSKSVRSWIRIPRLLGCLLLCLGIHSPAAAMPAVDLVLCLDGSGSIGSAGFQQEIEGTAAAIEDPSVVPQDGSVRITVLQFSNTVVVEVVPTVIDSTTARTVADEIRQIPFQDGATNIAGCIQEAVAQLGSATPASKKQIIDISTDGNPNIPNVDPIPATLASADAAVAAGVEAINAIGIGRGVSPTFLEQLVRPQPASDPDGDEDGFVILVDDISDFAEAIKKKIAKEVGSRCLTFVEENLLCPTDGSGDFTYTFELTNDSGVEVHHLFLLEDLPDNPLPPGVFFEPNYINFVDEFGAPLADGESREVTVEIHDASPGQEITFLLTLHDEQIAECCSVLHTVELPACDCAQVVEDDSACRLSFLPFDARWEYTFTLQNLFPGPVENVLLIPLSPQGLIVRPNHFLQLGLASVPYSGSQGQTTQTVTLDGPLSLFGQEACFLISGHDQLFAECCSIERCIDLEPCLAVVDDVHPIGDATLDFVGGQLLVSNIGSSGNDGVGFDTGTAESFEIAWVDPEAESNLPSGARLRTQVEDAEGELLAFTEVEKLGEGLVVRPGARSGIRQVELLEGGRVVETFSITESPAVRVPSGDWPTTGSYFGSDINVIVIWPASTTVRLDESPGQVFQVDQVRFVLEDDIANVVSSAALTAKDIPQVAITQAVAMPVSAAQPLRRSMR